MFLTKDDHSTIKHIIETRLGSLPGVAILETRIRNLDDCIRCGVLLDVDNLELSVQGLFELPPVFDKTQLFNEVDEVAEAVKAARLERKFTRLEPAPLQRPLPGNGLRGNWAKPRMM